MWSRSVRRITRAKSDGGAPASYLGTRSFPLLTLVARTVIAVTTMTALPSIAGESGDPTATKPTILRPAEIIWETRPSGVRVAALYGHSQEDGPFVLRLEYPPGYEKGPHYHPGDAFVTVTKGAYSRGYGAVWDRTQAYPLHPGTFSVNPSGVSHYEWTVDGAALQVAARGPWKSIYVDENGNPTDKMEKRPNFDTLKEPRVRQATDLEWNERGPGAEAAILDGDPSKAGPFAMRLRLAQGHTKGPHSHPSLVFVTVLSGTLRVGFGDSADDAKATTLEAGSFMALPAGTIHFESTPEDAVVEVQSQGPWTSLMATRAATSRLK